MTKRKPLSKSQEAELKRIEENLRLLAGVMQHLAMARHVKYAAADIQRFIAGKSPEIQKNCREEFPGWFPEQKPKT